MSTQPGARISPSASISRRPRSPTSPTSVMRPPSTATSAVRLGPPVPSTTVAPRMTRSCIPALYAEADTLVRFGWSVDKGLVDELLELGPDWVGAGREELGHEQGRDLLQRVDPEGGAGRAAPGELA